MHMSHFDMLNNYTIMEALPRNIREAKSLTVFKKSHLYPKY